MGECRTLASRVVGGPNYISESPALRNKLIEWERDDKGEVSLIIPQKQKLWIRLASKIFMLPDKRVIVLDDVGSYVWELCDGKNQIYQVVNQLCKQYKMTRKEAETSLLTYMRQLGKRGIIGFAVPKKQTKDSQAQS